jgi:hypothetical protein
MSGWKGGKHFELPSTSDPTDAVTFVDSVTGHSYRGDEAAIAERLRKKSTTGESLTDAMAEAALRWEIEDAFSSPDLISEDFK